MAQTPPQHLPRISPFWMRVARLRNRLQQRSKRDLSDYIVCRFNMLVGSYVAIIDKQDDAEAVRLIETLRQKSTADLDFDDLFKFETALLSLYGLEDLKRRAWLMRSEYRSVIGPSQYDLYIKSQPPDPTSNTVQVEELRADLQQLVSETYRLYSLIPARESTRNNIINAISSWLIVLSLVLIAYLVMVYGSGSQRIQWPTSIPVAVPVLFVGAVGGFVSMQRRLQSLSIEDNNTVGLLSLHYGRRIMFYAPITGAIFASVLYFTIAGGLVKGDLFPEIVNAEPPSASTFTSVRRFLDNTGPKTGKDFAKLLVWCFLAGFAEQLVPDTLNRIAIRQSSTEKTKDVTP